MSKKDGMVEYSKDIATSINEFSAYELDVFLSLVFVSRNMMEHHKISETENLKLELSSSTIKKFLSATHNSRIKKALTNIFDTKVYLKDDKYTRVRHIFEGLDYSLDYKTISFELKKEYIKLFYNLTGNFTQHKIKEFTSLKSRYAKRIYQLIMAYKGLYKWEFEADEFRKILDIPNSYTWPDVDTKIIKKVNRELTNNTNISKIVIEKKKVGRNIKKVLLKWKFKSPEILTELDNVKEPISVKENKKVINETETRKKLSDEGENLINIFENFDQHLKDIILNKAETYFFSKLGKVERTPIIEKIWESTKNVYIVKAMKGEI